MRSLFRFLVPTTLALLLGACGSSSAAPATSVATPTVASAASNTPAALNLSGTWSGTWQDTSPDTATGTFTLTWTQTQSRLKGTIKLSKPAGTYGISGAVTSSGIRFGAVKVGATYKGKVTGLLSMSGTWASPQGGGSWSAHRLLTKPKSTVK